MTTMMSTRPDIQLPREASETFTNELSTTPETTPGTLEARPLKVPTCRPTPLIGSWADESWPLNSRQASEIITEQVLQAQRSSIVFEDDEGNVLNADDDTTDNSSCDEQTIDESMMQEAMSHAQISTEEVSSTAQEFESPTHVAQRYMYDPYHISDCHTVLHRCTCEVCIPMLQQRHQQEQLLKQLEAPVHQDESASNRVSPAALKTIENQAAARPSAHSFLAAPPVQVQEEFHQEDNDWDMPTYNAAPQHQGNYPRAQQPQQHFNAPAAPQFHQFPTAPTASNGANGFMTHTQLSSPPFMEMNTPTPSPGNMNATPGSNVSGLSHPPPTQRRVVAPGEAPVSRAREVSTFMPPPPPPRIAAMVFEEEGSIKNPSGIYYHLVMRWYAKVQDSQEYFITADNLCPCPNKDRYSFEEWADQISGWWYTNFEGMQKKAPRFRAAGRR